MTPVYTSETLGKLAGRPVLLKAENLQRTGSFKIRGAYTKIASLSEEERRAGVVAASAGNHGQAVAWAAREAGIAATIFVPEEAPMAKVDATRGYGAEVVMVGAGYDEARGGEPQAGRRGRDAHPRVRRSRRDRGAGHARPRAGRAELPAETEVVVCRWAAAGSRPASRSR